MKTTRFFYSVLTGSLILAGLTFWPLAGGATTSTNTPAGVKGKPGAGVAGTNIVSSTVTNAGTNAVKEPLPIPASVFNVTLTPTKNPFFPLSLRQPMPQAVVAQGISASSFQLMALSGAEPRLAMINHRTLSEGEAVEVAIPAGKATIRLLQIKETSAVIRVVSPPQPDLIEVSLSKRAQ